MVVFPPTYILLMCACVVCVVCVCVCVCVPPPPPAHNFYVPNYDVYRYIYIELFRGSSSTVTEIK